MVQFAPWCYVLDIPIPEHAPDLSRDPGFKDCPGPDLFGGVSNEEARLKYNAFTSMMLILESIYELLVAKTLTWNCKPYKLEGLMEKLFEMTGVDHDTPFPEEKEWLPKMFYLYANIIDGQSSPEYVGTVVNGINEEHTGALPGNQLSSTNSELCLERNPFLEEHLPIVAAAIADGQPSDNRTQNKSKSSPRIESDDTQTEAIAKVEPANLVRMMEANQHRNTATASNEILDSQVFSLAMPQSMSLSQMLVSTPQFAFLPAPHPPFSVQIMEWKEEEQRGITSGIIGPSKCLDARDNLEASIVEDEPSSDQIKSSGTYEEVETAMVPISDYIVPEHKSSGDAIEDLRHSHTCSPEVDLIMTDLDEKTTAEQTEFSCTVEVSEREAQVEAEKQIPSSAFPKDSTVLLRRDSGVGLDTEIPASGLSGVVETETASEERVWNMGPFPAHTCPCGDVGRDDKIEIGDDQGECFQYQDEEAWSWGWRSVACN